MKIISRIFAVMASLCLWVACSEVEDVVPYVSVKKSSVTCESGSMYVSVQCSGSWSLTLQYEGVSGWASLGTHSGTGNKSDVVLRWEENEADEARTLTIVATCGEHSRECSVTQAAYTPGENGSGEVTPPAEDKPTPGASQAKADWLELPEMPEDKGLGYFSHSFEMDGKTYRNFTYGWSYRDYVAIWVAYPLCKFHTVKNVDRTNDWDYDPLLGPGVSSAPFGGYGEELARGHQLPSADRLCCYEANAQTFYGTNITPQMNQFNEGVWSNLEGKIRTIANSSDTTYVVTGCLVKDSKRETPDSDGNMMTVPSHYFKVVVRYSKSSTHGQWLGAAYCYEHKTATQAVSDGLMSIDEFEEFSGIDFFVNLPAKLGEDAAAKVESQNPESYSSVWL